MLGADSTVGLAPKHLLADEHAGRHEGLGLLLTSHRFAIGLGIAAYWPIAAADAMA